MGMLKDITEDKPLVVKCHSDWVIHVNNKDFDLERVQETLKNWSQKDKIAMIFRKDKLFLREDIPTGIPNNNSQQTTNKDQDNSQTEQQVQKEARTEENRSIAWGTHGHTWKVSRPQENTRSSEEHTGSQIMSGER